MSTFLTTGALKQDIVEITASSSAPLALHSLSQTIIHILGTDTQLVTLPDALTLEKGIHYVIVNDSTKSATIKDFDANTLLTLDTGFSAAIYLTNNITSSGLWAKVTGDRLFGDKNLKLIGGGIWSWNSGTETLTHTEDAYIVSMGLPPSANTIPAGSFVVTSGKIAYILLNRAVGLPNLTVYTALPEDVPYDSDILAIAYRDNDDIIVGNASFRLVNGQSGEVDQGISQENLALLGTGITSATSTANWEGRGSPLRSISKTDGITDAIASLDTEIDKFFGQLRIIPNPVDPNLIDVTGSDRVALHGEILSQELGSKLLNFSEAAIDFNTGEITQIRPYVKTTDIMTANELLLLDSDRISQSFICNFNGPLEKVTFYFNSNLGTNSGTLVVDIFEVDISGVPTGSSLGTSDGITVDGSLDGTPWFKVFTFSTPPSLFFGVHYAAVLRWQVAPVAGGDIEQLVGTSSSPIYLGDEFTQIPISVGQSFTPSSNITVSGISVKLFAPFNFPTGGTISVSIYNTIGGVKTGVALATSTTINATTLTSTATFYDFSFTVPVNLNSGTMYAFMVDAIGIPYDMNAVEIHISRPASDEYAGGTYLQETTKNDSIDLVFKIVTSGGGVPGELYVLGSAQDDYSEGAAWISNDSGSSWIQNIVLDFNLATGYVGAPLGLNFTPYSIPSGEYFWYSITLEYTETNLLGQALAQIRVGLAASSHINPDSAPFPKFPTLFNSRSLGFVQVYNNSGTIVPMQIRQLGVGGGGGGSGTGLISVRAADFTLTSLPSGDTLVIDGQTILEEELVLFGNTAINRIYKVTGIGSSLEYEEVATFSNGSVEPQDGNQVAVQDGDTNDVVWEWDEDTSTWNFISLTAENKQYLGLTSPDKTGGTWENQVNPLGQTNNILIEDDSIEKSLKRLDIRPDVLKRVRVIDLTSTSLPTTVNVTIDGISLINGDKVLFGDASLLGIYQVAGIGVGATWEKLDEFGGANVPAKHDAVLVREGSDVNCTIWLYDNTLTPPWHRVSGPASTIWTGADPNVSPTWDGTLNSNDTTVKLALDTIDKYFRGLQLRQHPTNPKRVVILASNTTKTDLTVLNFTIADRLMSFSGAEIDFETGNIYASNGVDVIGSFSPQTVLEGEFYWYGIGLDASTPNSSNTINPQITIDYSTGSGATPDFASKPSLTSRYTLGAVVVEGGIGGVGIGDITQGSIVYLGQFTGFTDLENTVEQHTIDISALQSFMSAAPIQQAFIAGAGGQSLFELTDFTVDASNSVFDVDYYLDGRWQTQSVLGDFSDGAVRKNSTIQIETSEPVPEGKSFVVVKRTMSGSDPLVDLTGITVNLGFITPKTVGTYYRPAWSFILKDKVTADIWELEVRDGVFQVVKLEAPTSLGFVPAGSELTIGADEIVTIPST